MKKKKQRAHSRTTPFASRGRALSPTLRSRPAPPPFLSSYTQVPSVIFDSGSVPRRVIFSSRETSPLFPIVAFGFRVSGLGFRVLGFGNRVSGLGPRVSCFGLLVSVFGFRASGFGSRGLGSGCLGELEMHVGLHGHGRHLWNSGDATPCRMTGVTFRSDFPESLPRGTPEALACDPIYQPLHHAMPHLPHGGG